MRLIFSFALCCFGLVLLFSLFSFFPEIPNQLNNPLPAALSHPQKQEPREITLLFVGDIMLDRGVEWQIQKNGGDWRWPFLKIADIFQKADLVFGNLESQISDRGTNVGSIYSFRANPRSLEGLVYAGFDVLSVANNHSFDYTRAAFEDSLSKLQEAGITPVANDIVIKVVGDTKFGFLAYSNFPGAAHVSWDSLSEITQSIQDAKSQVDILAVSLHAGEEYQTKPNAFQKTFAKAALDAGANLVIGHHPHVLQPLEQYKQGWIAYSLGNFVFDQDFSDQTMTGAILKVAIKDKSVSEITLIPTRLNFSYQVELTK